MTVEAWKSLFDVLTVVLLGLTFFAGAGVLITGNIINRGQDEKLRQFDHNLTAAKSDLAAQQERAAKAEASVALAEQHAAEANTKAEGFRLDIAKANEGAARANEMAEQERLARIKIEERVGGWKLSKDAQDDLSKVMKPFAGTHFSLIANPIEEPFVEMLDRILRDAGWIREAPLDDNGNAATILLSGKAMVAFSSGLSVVVSQDEFAALSPAAEAYKQALLADGFEVKLEQAVPPINKIAPTVIKFIIGKRD